VPAIANSSNTRLVINPEILGPKGRCCQLGKVLDCVNAAHCPMQEWIHATILPEGVAVTAIIKPSTLNEVIHEQIRRRFYSFPSINILTSSRLAALFNSPSQWSAF
jgi:hypothetical protein